MRSLNLFLVLLSCLFLEIIGQDVLTEATTLSNEIEDPDTPSFTFLKDRKSSGLSKRIIGGNVATANQFPYQVALFVYEGNTVYFCGGSLITDSWVLTAAHCIDSASYVIAALGSHDLSSTESSRIVLNSSKFIIHEDWDESLLQNDVALIQLPESVTINQQISTIKLAEGTNTYDSLMSICLGWGITIYGSTSNVLRYVDLEVITNEKCSAYRDYSGYIVDTHICTSGNGTLGSCNGDSGGPLVINGEQIGIVSFGAADCQAGLPSVFTRVTEYNSWIQDALNGTYIYTDPSSYQGNNGYSIQPISVLNYLLIILFIYRQYI
ncbi:brachyurin-like [Sitophilus oryzae]|uniref:Brachyurin-like n=1 Tax=Sitophilus oryzae TaxID=7048 RepID=A0A6J2XD04_SITOR|nr:brachyurin-like [Sitophilus oryzae]